MSDSIKNLGYAIGLDISELDEKADQAANKFRKISDSAKDNGTKIVDAFKKVGAAMGIAFSMQQATEFVKKIVEVRSSIQSLEVSFATLLGSEEKAASLLGEIRQFAVSTPMMLGDLAKGAQTMLAFNIEAEKVMPILRAIGDISMGDAQKFGSLTLAFSQMSATGKLMGQDLLQMINAGFNPLATISEKTGKSVATLKDEMSKGAISAEMVTQAFIDATSEGGKFFGMLNKRSQTMQGAISNLQGAWEDMLNAMGEKMEGVATKAILSVTEIVKNYEKIGKVVGDIVVAFGTYKAALIAYNAILAASSKLVAVYNNTHLVRQLSLTKQLTLAQRKLNAAIMANPVKLTAAAIAAVSVGLYKWAKAADQGAEGINRFNKYVAEQTEGFEKLREANKNYIDAVSDEDAPYIKREAAMKSLIGVYPEILNKYKTEKEALGDIAGVMDVISNAESIRALNADEEKAIELEKQIAQLNSDIQINERNAYGSQAVASLRNMKRELEKELEQVNQKIAQNRNSFVGPTMSTKKGSTVNNTVTEEQKKAAKELAEAEKEMWLTVYEAEVSAMQDGKEKTLKEIDLKMKQELAAIDEEQAALEAKAKEAGTKVSQATYDQLATRRNYAKSTALSQVVEVEEENAKYITSLYNDMAEVFESDEQKKVRAIKETYAERLKTLEKDRKNGTVSDTDYQALKEQYKQGEQKEIDDYWTEQYGTYEQKLDALKAEWAEKLKDIPAEFADEANKQMNAAITDFVISNSDVKTAYTDLFDDFSEKSVESLRKIEERGKSLMEFLKGDWDAGKGIALGISEEQFNTLKASPEQLEKIGSAVEKVGDSADQAENGFGQFVSGLEKIGNSDGNFKKMQEGLSLVSSAVSQATQALCFLSDALGSIAEANGNESLQSISDGLNVASEAMSSAMSGAQAGAALGPWGAAAGAAIGLVSSLYSNISKLYDEKQQDKIEATQKKVNKLQDAYDELDELVSKAFGSNKTEYYQKENENLLKQNQLIRQQIADEKSKKNSDADAIEEYNDQIKENNKLIAENKELMKDAIFGSDIQSAISGFADAMADAWSSGSKGAASARDYVKQMMQDMVTESVKAYIQSSEQMDNIRTALSNAWSDEIFTTEEQAKVMQMADDLASEIDKKYGTSSSLFSSSRSASAASGIVASQESVDALDGIMTNVQEHTYTISQCQAQLVSVANAILEKVAGIEKNTASSDERLAGISKTMDHVKSCMDEVISVGVKLRQ